MLQSKECTVEILQVPWALKRNPTCKPHDGGGL